MNHIPNPFGSGPSGASPPRFVSYAQNFEDIVLWRVLGDVIDGTYIDVGAAWPDIDSVTKAFSDRGWCGVNIEANAKIFETLSSRRPRDVNVCVAVGGERGSIEFNAVKDTGLSTIDPGLADRYRQEGRQVESVTVPMVLLDDVWSEHLDNGRAVHFLKVDVEGAEGAVLAGLDLAVHRPWVLVIEATRPNSPESAHEEWEPGVLAAGYSLVYEDGLNRFYLADEHADLRHRFHFPPNVFDHFVTFNDQQRIEVAEQRATWLDVELKLAREHADRVAADAAGWHEERAALLNTQRDLRLSLVAERIATDDALAKATSLRERLGRVQAEAWGAMHELALRDQRIAALEGSTSWRVTRPVRVTAVVVRRPSSVVRWTKRRLLNSRLRRPLDSAIRAVLDRPVLHRTANVVLARAPGFRRRVHNYALTSQVIVDEPALDDGQGHDTRDHPMATPAERRLHERLRRTIPVETEHDG